LLGVLLLGGAATVWGLDGATTEPGSGGREQVAPAPAVDRAAPPRAADEVQDDPSDPGPDPGPDPDPAPEVDPTPALGRFGDLPLHLPSASPVVVGFHEAATVHAFDVTPAGELLEDRNTTRTDLPDDEPDGPGYLVLTSRGRSAGPTSSIDVVLADDDPVLATVSGTVADVRSYLLYGSHRDVRVEIVPDGHPDVRVVAIHLVDPAVAIGDPVVGGVSPIAGSVRSFPFSSHIDRETEPERFGHVHLEVQPADLRRPGDDEDEDEDEEAGEGEDGEVAASR
jgi:hypothetical protein